MAVKPTHLGKAGKRVLNDQFFKKAKVKVVVFTVVQHLSPLRQV